MKFWEKIQSLWSGHGVLEMDKLKKIEDIKTEEIAQKVVKEYDECSGKICEDCFLKNLSCGDAYTIAQDFLEKAKSPKKPEPEPAVPSIQWIDDRYMKVGAPAKKIQTIEEALAILVEHETCSGRNCDDCGMQMYEKHKGGGCINVHHEATQFLAVNLGLDPGQHLSGNHIYSYLMKQPVPSTIPAKEPVPVIDRCASCKTCKNYNPVGGVPFCNAWHNYTQPEGNCYMYDPATERDEPEKVETVNDQEKIESQKRLERLEKAYPKKPTTESSDDEASLPF